MVVRALGGLAGVLAALALLPAAAAADPGPKTTKPVGWQPLSSKEAARRVHRSSFEPRPDNYTANHTVPTRAQLRAFWAYDQMPYAGQVNGHFKGTTDEIIQWAAYKWGFPADVLRSVAVHESWWHMSTLGDQDSPYHSYGLFQVRMHYHCGETISQCPEAQDSTAFNADYYGAQLRAYYDGLEGWLNTNTHTRPYVGGDLWGSIGAWATGNWYWPSDQFNTYITGVQQALANQTWRTDPYF